MNLQAIHATVIAWNLKIQLYMIQKVLTNEYLKYKHAKIKLILLIILLFLWLLVEEGLCLYNKSFHEDQSHATYERFGINAAHAILPIFTKVQLKYNNKTIDVTINGFPTESNKTILQLSREAALMLDIADDGYYPCSIGVYEPEPDYVSLKKIVTVTASFCVVVLLIITFL